MKKLFPFLAGLLMILIISCKKDPPESGKKTGSLIVEIGLSIREYELNKGLKSAQQTEDFKVIVYHADGTVAMIFETVSVMPDTIELEPGNYYVEAHSDNDLPAAFENPYYYGLSEIFTIQSSMQQSAMVTCSLANTMVTVVYSDYVKSHFIDFTTTVSTVLDTLVYTKDETRPGYFRTFALDILVDLSWMRPDGTDSSKQLSGSIPEPLTGRHYEISVNSIIENGMSTFQVLMDETEIPVEVIEISDDTLVSQITGIGYGDILITEIMFDPLALSDTDGEWFEIYNNSDQSINLQDLVLKRDDANLHAIADSIVLSPGAYFVFTRTQTAVNVANSYVYGSAILLPNTGAVLAIYNKNQGTDPGALIFSVNYGGLNFPSLPGASISLNPDMTSAGEAITGTSWCTSGTVFSTGDKGTPGVGNNTCQ